MNMVVLKVHTHKKYLQRMCCLSFLNYSSHSDVRSHQVEINIFIRKLRKNRSSEVRGLKSQCKLKTQKSHKDQKLWQADCIA